jgi:hypothetical protein
MDAKTRLSLDCYFVYQCGVSCGVVFKTNKSYK